MKTLYHLLLFASTLGIAASRPQPVGGDGAFTVEQVPNPDFVGHNMPRYLINAYRKYGHPVDDKLHRLAEEHDVHLEKLRITKRRAEKRKDMLLLNAMKKPTPTIQNLTTAVEAVPTELDTEYLSPVVIGNQTLNMHFDTASSDLWVFSNNMTDPFQQAKANKGHTLFDPSKSPTYIDLQGTDGARANFSIGYGDSSWVEGYAGIDRVTIGTITSSAQSIGLATNVSSKHLDMKADGILGLGLKGKVSTTGEAWLPSVESSLDYPFFSAELPKGRRGVFTFGAKDFLTYNPGTPLYHTKCRSSKGWWEVESNLFAIQPQNTSDLNLRPGGEGMTKTYRAHRAVLDTGTALMFIDRFAARTYYGQVPGAVPDGTTGAWVVPCDAELPDLFVTLSENGLKGRGKSTPVAKIRGFDINFGPMALGPPNMCWGGIQETPFWKAVYGTVFFRSNYVAFNYKKGSVAFAPISDWYENGTLIDPGYPERRR